MRRRAITPTGAGFAAFAWAAASQLPGHASAADTTSLDAKGGLEEVIVTARRRDESLQDVPQTVNAVSSETLEELNLLKFEDVQAVIPGLTLASGNTGYTTAATLRGASFQVESGATPTVEFYLNDALTTSNLLFQSLYDVGQIEVLRGPQGTLRGRASPSGSITVTTRRPDVSEYGGYVSASTSDTNSNNAQGAFNLPILRDTLALRLAGVHDEGDYDEVRSINNSSDPFTRTNSGRATLRWEASDSLTATVMYQQLRRDFRSYDAMMSFNLLEPTAPAVNTPADPQITASDRRGLSDDARDAEIKQGLYTGQVDYRFAGQQLSYVGMYSDHELIAAAPLDPTNRARDFEYFQLTHTWQKSKTHELRLASEERLFNLFDYTVGAFSFETESPSAVTNRTLFGTLSGGNVTAVRVSDTAIQRGGATKETSFFGNATVHIGADTEVSAGARHINFESRSTITVGGRLLADIPSDENPTIYNVSASHRFSDNYMLYANYGESWRQGPTAIGVFRTLTPRLQQFIDLDPETSQSYELGFKAIFLDSRLRVNAAIFRQEFKDFIYRGPPVYYVDIGPAGPRPSTFNFVANVDAEVAGFELDIGLAPIDRLSIDATVSYAKGEMQDGVIACNDFNGDGVPDRNPPAPTAAQIRAAAGGEEVAQCMVNDRLSFSPDWSGTLQAEYSLPVSAKMDAFGRGLYTYYTDNVQDPNNPYDNIDAYGLLNLYAGLRSSDGAWEVSVFARNVTNTGEMLSAGNGAVALSYQQLLPPAFTTSTGASLASPYTTTRFTPPREIGLSVRYAFGSR